MTSTLMSATFVLESSASAEEGSDRHVAHQSLGNRSLDQLANALDALGAVGSRPGSPSSGDQ